MVLPWVGATHNVEWTPADLGQQSQHRDSPVTWMDRETQSPCSRTQDLRKLQAPKSSAMARQNWQVKPLCARRHPRKEPRSTVPKNTWYSRQGWQ